MTRASERDINKALSFIKKGEFLNRVTRGLRYRHLHYPDESSAHNHDLKPTKLIKISRTYKKMSFKTGYY